MPNIVGGDQHHPAYDPRTKIEDNQVLVGNDLYEIKVSLHGSVTVYMQGVADKNATVCDVGSCPREVKEKIKELQNNL